MSIYVVSTYPSNDLEQVIAKLTEKTKLRVLLDGNFDGTISSLYNADEYGDSSIVLECSETSAFAFMDWVQSNSPITLKAVGLQFDNGWNIGAVALTKGQFTLMTTEDLSVLGNHMAQQQMIADGEEIDPDEDYEFEWSDVRDEVQLSFIHHMAEHGSAEDLDEIEPFKTFKQIGGNYAIDVLEDAPSNIAAKLSQKIDFYNYELMGEIFAQQGDEFWKDHRTRIRDLMEDLPEDLKSSKNFFKQIVPSVSSWLFEYAAEEVKADKEVMLMGAKADVANNWGASVLEYCSETLKTDRKFIKDLIKINANEYYNLNDAMKNDRELALSAADKVYAALPDALKNDEEIIIAYAKTGDWRVFNDLPEGFKVNEKIAYAYLEGGGDLEDIPEEFINDKTLLFSLSHIKEGRDRGYALGKAIEKKDKPVSLELAQKILEIDLNLVAAFDTDWLSAADWNELFTNEQIILTLPFELGRNLIVHLDQELETNNLIRPYRQKELGDTKEKMIRDVIKTYAEVLVKEGDCFSKETEPYFEQTLDSVMILFAPVDLAYFKAGKRSGLIQAINENSDEEGKTDIEQDEEYLKLNEEAEQLSKNMLEGINALCAKYLIDLSEADLITLPLKEEG
jgi:hypothetical protein